MKQQLIIACTHLQSVQDTEVALSVAATDAIQTGLIDLVAMQAGPVDRNAVRALQRTVREMMLHERLSCAGREDISQAAIALNAVASR